jgi:hypothetical protein
MEPRSSSPPHSQISWRIHLVAGIVLAGTLMPAPAARAQPSSSDASKASGAASAASGAATAANASTASGAFAICDSTAPLTAIGMDTQSGLVLFAVGGSGGAAGSWIVALETASPADAVTANDSGTGGATNATTAFPALRAQAYPERTGARFGGSVGPGPVLALQPCGPECLQPVRFGHGEWPPLGEPVTVPSASTAALTYDASGAPWLVAHAAANQEGLVQAFSYRFEASAWKSHGGLAVTALSQPQAVPAPQRRDGVISGTGLFSASGPPTTWVAGLPGVPPARRGQLLALPGTDAAYLAADGVAYLSADSGKTWRRSTWTPWGGGDTTGIWRQGTDYGIDLPFGDHRGQLQLVWFDRRSPAAERMVLTRLGAGGVFTELAAAPTDVTTRNGDHLPVTQVLIPTNETWLLLSGCAATATGSGLVLRTFEKNQLSEPRFIPIVVEAKVPSEPKPPPH